MTDTERKESEGAAERLQMQPLRGPRSEPWSVQLDEELLSLHAPDGRVVLMLPRQEATRHLRFEWDLLRGRTVAFVVVEGLSTYRFRSTVSQTKALLDWLPLRSRDELEREARRYGIALVLLGALQLLLQDFFFWATGLLLLLLGLAIILYPRRIMYALNALVMFPVGIALLLWTASSTGPLSGDEYEMAQVLNIGLGSLLLIWSVQQLSLLGPNRLLLVPRRRRMLEDDDNLEPSPLIRKVGWAMGALSLLFVFDLGGLVAQYRLGELTVETPSAFDWVLCLTLACITVGAAVSLLVRRNISYLEAKITGQFGIVLAMLRLAGALARPLDGSRLPFDPDILWVGLFALGELYFWVPLIICIVLFNWWFNRVAQREMKEIEE